MLTETATSTQPRTKMFLDIPTAAEMAGFSIRHFRRIIEEDRIPVLKIGPKDFITASALTSWNSTHGEARLEQCIKQLDGWLQEDLRRSPEPVPSWDDEE
jgi:hypothetical protein